MLTVPVRRIADLVTPGAPPEWYWVAGTWGDALAGLGNVQELARRLGSGRVRVIHYGPDARVAEWLGGQRGAREVRHVAAGGRDAYRAATAEMPTDPDRREEWLPGLLRGTGLDWRGVWPAHVDFTLRERPVVYRPHDLQLPEGLRYWALTLRRAFPGPVILLQPRSEASCDWSGHWPHWYAAVRHLLEAGEATVLLCGAGYDAREFGSYPRLVNLVDRTPSMPHLFAVAEVVDRTVTTSNGLALWCAARGLPAVVACNRTHNRPEHFFTRFLRVPSVRVIEHWDSWERFPEAMEPLRSDASAEALPGLKPAAG